MDRLIAMLEGYYGCEKCGYSSKTLRTFNDHPCDYLQYKRESGSDISYIEYLLRLYVGLATGETVEGRVE